MNDPEVWWSPSLAEDLSQGGLIERTGPDLWHQEHGMWHRLDELPADAVRLVPDTGQAREATGRRDTAVEAAVAAWRDVQPHPFVMPEEMTELAIALDELTAAHETVSALVPRETTDTGQDPDDIRGWLHEQIEAGGDPMLARVLDALNEPSGDTGQAPDVAALLRRLDEQEAQTERFGERGFAWLHTSEIRALLGTDTTPKAGDG